MSYRVKEIFYSLQGEGANTGRGAVFVRFSGCNLWSGCESDRAAATCKFCDTDFVGTDGGGGGVYETAGELVGAVVEAFPQGGDNSMASQLFVVCTGGEPLLQLDAALIAALHAAGCQIAVETNGTIAAPDGIDWITVSPKPNTTLVQRSGHELKLVYPIDELAPSDFENLPFERFYIQPLDPQTSDGDNCENVKIARDFCLANPQWRLSLQMHKILGIR
ncbi:MAG: 7-carboxy-7-deazaguanine synthase [Phycisphaerae bacterium]|nr:7-carboxy-7-deazaguanine synthase [Phycisphaerae bacterium]